MAAAFPRFRRDLEAVGIEEEGVQYVDVSDRSSGRHFRFYDFEHAAALALDGRPFEEVSASLQAEAGLELSVDQLAAFSDQLLSLGFLVVADDDLPALATPGRIPEREAGDQETPMTVTLGVRSAGVDRLEPTASQAGDLPAVFAESPRVSDAIPDLAIEELSASALVSDPPSAVGPLPPIGAPPRSFETSIGFSASSPDPGAVQPAAVASGADHESTLMGDWPPPAAELAQAPASETISEFPPELAPAAFAPSQAAASAVDKSIDPPTVRESFPARDSARVAVALEDSGPARLDLNEPAQTDGSEEKTKAAGAAFGDLMDLSGAQDVKTEHPTSRNPTSPVADLLLDAADPRTTDEPAAEPAVFRPVAVEPSTPPRRPWVVYAGLGVLAAAGAVGVTWKSLVPSEPAPVSVTLITPAPTSVYKWFGETSVVRSAAAEGKSLGSAGKIAEILPAGSKFSAGDVLVLLEAGRKIRTEVAHNRERLGYYEQMFETMKQGGNRPEMRQAEIKAEEKRKLLTESQSALAQFAVIAARPGAIAETLVAVGATVKAGEPLLKTKAGDRQAEFALGPQAANALRLQGFCRAEVEGRPTDCTLLPPPAPGGQPGQGEKDGRVTVSFPPEAISADGQAVRLSSGRLDSVFPVPLGALVRVGDSDRLWVASPQGRAELRVVVVAERTADSGLISQGLDVGDRVIAAVTPDLAPGRKIVAPSQP